MLCDILQKISEKEGILFLMTILKMVYLTALENIRYAEKFANIGEAVAKSCRTEYNYKKLIEILKADPSSRKA